MKKNQKLIAYGAGGLVLAFLLYRWYQGRSSGAATAATDQLQTNPTDQSSAGYAALAGTEQADVAALQAQEQQGLAGLQTQEAMDIAGLGSQETTDVAGLSGQLAGIAGTIAGLTATEQQLQNEIAAGHKPAGAAPQPGAPPGFAFGRTKPHAPAGYHYTGVGSGIWRLVKNVATGDNKPNPHSSAHQAGNPGNYQSAPTGHAVAPSTHAPKPTTIRRPNNKPPATKPGQYKAA